MKLKFNLKTHPPPYQAFACLFIPIPAPPYPCLFVCLAPAPYHCTRTGHQTFAPKPCTLSLLSTLPLTRPAPQRCVKVLKIKCLGGVCKTLKVKEMMCCVVLLCFMFYYSRFSAKVQKTPKSTPKIIPKQ